MSGTQPPADDNDRTVIRAPTPAAPTEPRGEGNALPIGTRLGEFEIIGVVGEGGFGIVYLVLDHSLGRRVALKEYMPSALAARGGGAQVSVKSSRHRETFELGLKSFVNEARLLAQFDHPSLVKVYRFWEGNGTAYMVMPFYEGTTLRERLHAMGSPPDESWLMGLLAPLTEALQVIHAEQCYHRDIAPDNIILLEGSGRPVLLDFGAARRVIGDMTQALTVILKPGYAPLEQYAEVPGLKQGPWTDVYALAAVVYFAIVGRTPPPAVGRSMHDQYEPLSQLAAGRYSLRLTQAVDRALRVMPKERTASIAEFRAQLGLAAAAPEPQDTTRPPRQAPQPAPRRVSQMRVTPTDIPQARGPVQHEAPARARTGLWLGLGGALVAAALAGVLLVWAPWQASPPPKVAASDAPPPATTGDTPAPTPPAADQPVAPAAPQASIAAAPAAPAPAPAAPPAPSSVADEFTRIVSGQASGFDVGAVPVRSELLIGRDPLSFTVTSAREGHVYVLVHGPDDSLVLLFPNRASSNSRIRAGQKLTLPQASWPMMASDPPGPERFLIIVSARPREFAAIDRGRDGPFTKLPSGQAALALARAHIGPGSVLAGKATCDEAGCDEYGAAQFVVQVRR
jgi:serine/threonine protein kinase